MLALRVTRETEKMFTEFALAMGANWQPVDAYYASAYPRGYLLLLCESCYTAHKHEYSTQDLFHGEHGANVGEYDEYMYCYYCGAWLDVPLTRRGQRDELKNLRETGLTHPADWGLLAFIMRGDPLIGACVMAIKGAMHFQTSIFSLIGQTDGKK